VDTIGQGGVKENFKNVYGFICDVLNFREQWVRAYNYFKDYQ
jgi:hypothetical protein